MGSFFFSVGIGLTALLVLFVIGSMLDPPVDPEDDDEDDDPTDLYTPTVADVVGCPLDVSADTGEWVRSEGRVLKTECEK